MENKIFDIGIKNPSVCMIALGNFFVKKCQTGTIVPCEICGKV